MEKNNKTQKSLLDWLGEFYDDTGKLSGIIRNLAFAGIGLIWIFRNPDLTESILPQNLLLPLLFIVLCLISDVLQYLWRSISIYTVYKCKEVKYLKEKLKEKEISNITIPNFISVITWIFFWMKIIFIATAYVLLCNFIVGKL